MAAHRRILIAGGYGVFGRLLSQELLAHTDADVVIAGRALGKAEQECGLLGWSRAAPLRLDLSEPGALQEAAKGCFAVVGAAGPFQGLRQELPAEAIAAGAHWLDIADDEAWVERILSDEALDERASHEGLFVGTGLSTFPAMSGALARWLVARYPRATRARVVLFIGNRNEKGPAAVASALSSTFREPVDVVTPFGRVASYAIDAAGPALFHRELGLTCECRAALESPVLGRAASFAGMLISHAPKLMDPVVAISRLSRMWSLGMRGGCVQVEVEDLSGPIAAAAFVGEDQRMAVLPVAVVVEGLLEGSFSQRGVVSPLDRSLVDDRISASISRGLRFRWRDVSSSFATGP